MGRNTKSGQSKNAEATNFAKRIYVGERLSGLKTLGLNRFEDEFKELFTDPPHGALIPITRTSIRETRSDPSYFQMFETLSLAVRRAYFDSSASPSKKDMDAYSAKDIREGVVEFIKQLTPKQSKPPPALKIIGCYIDGDLDLSNLEFPASIRLMGCVIEGALILDRTQLVTLDLSGSIVTGGISGMYMKATGAFRARRTVFRGPVDLGGAEIGGTVDMTDSILSPENSPSVRASYVTDRGILNLAQTRLDKDLRLERARVYGGINLRGSSVGGIFYLNDAVLRSPMAHLELIVRKFLPKPKIPVSAELSFTASEKIAEFLHPEDLKDDPKKPVHGDFSDRKVRQKWELLGGEASSGSALKDDVILQKNLLSYASALSGAALRAEQMTVAGPVYARGLRTSGMLRLKRLKSGGVFSLNGSCLRSPGSVAQSLLKLKEHIEPDADNHRDCPSGSEKPKRKKRCCAAQKLSNEDCETIKLISEIFDGLEKRLTIKADENEGDYVLDLEHSNLQGALDLSWDKREWRIRKTLTEPLKDLFGKATDAISKQYTSNGVDSWDKSILPAHFVETGDVGYTPSLIFGAIKLDNIQIDGSADFRNTVFDLCEDYPFRESRSVNARNAKIKQHLDFRGSVGANGISLTYAVIEAGMWFYRTEEIVNPEACSPSPTERALIHRIFPDKKNPGPQHHPLLDLSMTEVGGSAYLVFHPELGPTLRFPYGKVGSELQIMPADNCFKRRDLGKRKPSFLKKLKQKRADRAAQVKPASTASVNTRYPKFPEIDLNGLETSFFSHNAGAWPRKSHLMIRNLRYEATNQHGHLFPPLRDSNDQTSKNLRPVHKRLRDIVATILRLIIALVSLSTAAVLFGQGIEIPHLDIGWMDRVVEVAGHLNVILAMLTIGLVSLSSLVIKNIPPLKHELKPRAVHWLERQKPRQNTYRQGKMIKPAEPYLRAAYVLRAEGRSSSASRVDLERLRLRRHALSWKKAWAAKLFLSFVDAFIRYGFKPVRGVTLTIGMVILSAMAFNVIRLSGTIVPADTVDFYEEKKVLGRHADRLDRDLPRSPINDIPRTNVTIPANQQGRNEPTVALEDASDPSSEIEAEEILVQDQSPPPVPDDPEEDQPPPLDQSPPVSDEEKKDQCIRALESLQSDHFHSLFYTIDAFVPFIDMNVEKEWTIIDPDRLLSILDCKAVLPLMTADDRERVSIPQDRNYISAILVKLMGWGLITTLAFSLLIRFETLLIRSNN